MKASDSLVNARTLRSIICNCSSWSSELAAPTRPKPALLTTNCGSAPCAVSASPITRAIPGFSKSAAKTNGRGAPVAAISSPSARSLSSLRATSANSCPLQANTRARATPIPAEAPVMTATGRRLLIVYCNLMRSAARSRTADRGSTRLRDFGIETFERTSRRLNTPEVDRDNLNYDQADHQPHHARQLIVDHQIADDERRHHCGATAQRVADAVRTKADLGRKQFRRVDAEEDCGLDVDRDDQDCANRKHDHRIGGGVEMRVNPTRGDREKRSADDAPASPDIVRQNRAERATDQRSGSKHDRVAE